MHVARANPLLVAGLLLRRVPLLRPSCSVPASSGPIGALSMCGSLLRTGHWATTSVLLERRGRRLCSSDSLGPVGHLTPLPSKELSQLMSDMDVKSESGAGGDDLLDLMDSVA